MMAPQNHKLGVPLMQERFAHPHEVGIRYWTLSEGGWLGAPIGAAAHWAPGLNKARCTTKNCKSQTCSCGLYGFRLHSVIPKSYFTFETGVPNAGPDAGVMGAFAYWFDKFNAAPGQMIRARYGAPAALTFPKGCSDSHRELIKLAAENYRVEIVEPHQLKDTVSEFLEHKLPEFWTPPMRPLFELLGLEGPDFTAREAITVAPRRRPAPRYILEEK